jgi:deoxyadenosine/deoxycytidine kinase
MNLNYTVVSFDGNIGSGKSTLLQHMKDKYRENPCYIFLKEPVDEWSLIKDENNVTILEKFYTDQVKYSFAFQMMAYISRLNVFKNAVKGMNPNKKYVIITERTLNTDRFVFAKMLFETGKMDDVMYQVYLKWFDTFSSEFSVDKVVYIKTLPEVCFERVTKRSREGEEIIPLEYLKSCDMYHDEMIQNNNTSDKLVLDGNIDIYTNTEQVENWIQEINEFINCLKI